MFKIKQVFDIYADEVSCFQYRNFNPTSALNLNYGNKKTTLKLDIEDDFISKDIEYYIEGKITPLDVTKTYSNKSNIKMLNNFVVHLFPQIEVKKHGTVIDERDFTGIVSTVKGCVSYPGVDEYNGKAINSGFKTFAHEGQRFSVVGKPGDLGLDFFNDITVPIYKGGFEITFTKTSDNNSIFHWKGLNDKGVEDVANLPVEDKVTINNFYLRVPIIEYNSEAKTNLINDLFKENYVFKFKKWHFIQHIKVTGKSLNFDITNIYRNVQDPIWTFVVFQNNQLNNQQKDNSTFDQADVKDMWIELRGRRYPEESLNLDWDTDNYCIAYVNDSIR